MSYARVRIILNSVLALYQDLPMFFKVLCEKKSGTHETLKKKHGKAWLDTRPVYAIHMTIYILTSIDMVEEEALCG